MNPARLPSSFSNYGGKYVDLFAPVSQIYAPIPSGGYASMSGTSMASPLVAGVASLLLSYNPDLRAHDLKEILVNSSRKESYDVFLPSKRKAYSGKKVSFEGLSLTGGVLDAYRAISYLKRNF